MSFLQLAKQRYSVRKYENRAVEEEKLAKILEAGRVAPTACNNQPQKVLVVHTEEGMEKVAKGARTCGAPVALIVCADHGKSWRRSYDGNDSGEVDAGIVATHMMLEATELGLGTLWIGAFNPAAIRSEFHIPENVQPVSVLLVGYAADRPASPDRHETARKKLEETVFYDHF